VGQCFTPTGRLPTFGWLYVPPGPDGPPAWARRRGPSEGIPTCIATVPFFSVVTPVLVELALSGYANGPLQTAMGILRQRASEWRAVL